MVNLWHWNSTLLVNGSDWYCYPSFTYFL
jgi:hypothetical protein